MMDDVRIFVPINTGNMCKVVGEERTLETQESTTMEEVQNKVTSEIYQQ